MKVQCLDCNAISDDSEWLEYEFYCCDCEDDHTGNKCPAKGCYSVEGPGRIGWRGVTDSLPAPNR
jgi:hypothetical protein